MTVEIIPTALFSLDNITRILRSGKSSILHKLLHVNLEHKAIYVTTPLIVFIRQGKQILRDYDDIEHIIEENNLIFISKGVYTVSDYVMRHGIFECFLFFYDDQLITQYLEMHGASHISKPVSKVVTGTCILPANMQIQRYVSAVENVYANQNSSGILLNLKLMELLHLITLQDKSDRFVRELVHDNGRGIKIRKITDFMEKYYSHKLKIEDYALLTGRSVSTFIRDFKKSYNTTPNRWLIEKKMAIAHQLLVDHNYTVIDAATEVGYENTSYFISAYKRKYGVTPKRAKPSSNIL